MAERPAQPEGEEPTDDSTSARKGTGDTPTRGVRRHFPATDDGLAIGLLLSLILYVGLDGLGVGGFSLGDTNPAVLGVYLTIVGVASAWAFGKRAVKTWRSGSSIEFSQR